jgi:glycosyltransferase involved in cell wall biosynthesis
LRNSSIEEKVKTAKNVVIYKKHIDSFAYHKLQVSIGIHLCPSMIEGFGHYINEARALGRLAVTTDLAPMNELVDDQSGFVIPASTTEGFGRFAEWGIRSGGVTAEDIAMVMRRVFALSLHQRSHLANQAWKR